MFDVFQLYCSANEGLEFSSEVKAGRCESASPSTPYNLLGPTAYEKHFPIYIFTHSDPKLLTSKFLRLDVPPKHRQLSRKEATCTYRPSFVSDWKCVDSIRDASLKEKKHSLVNTAMIIKPLWGLRCHLLSRGLLIRFGFIIKISPKYTARCIIITKSQTNTCVFNGNW